MLKAIKQAKPAARQMAEFKPGATPSTNLGNEVLNHNIPWSEVVQDIIKTGYYTLAMLADKIDTKPIILNAIADGDDSNLDFKTGAKLLSVHCRLYPDVYM
tara:strand:+ start:69295 stop:69597 length:303 start_codon:yes stop_codon:yes gene_type:complete